MAGVHFLMETAAMVDQIVNTTALSFIFTVDEMILERLTTKATKHMMANLTDYPLFNIKEHDEEHDQAVLDRYEENEMHWTWRCKDCWLLPRRLAWSVLLMTVFTLEYYHHNCTRLEDGSWISKDISLPILAHLNPLCLIVPCSHTGGAPVWTSADLGLASITIRNP